MEMVENDTLVNDRKEDVANGGCGPCLGRNSPWKKPAEKPAGSPVMGLKTWPALSNVQRAKTAEVPNTNSQTSDGHKKSNGGGSRNSAHKNGQPHYHRGGCGSKRNQNGGPPFPVPVVPHVYYPRAASVLQPIPGHPYGYQPMPAPFPGADNHLVKLGSQIPMKAFGPHLQGMDASLNFQPPAQGDQVINAPKYSGGRRPNAAEGGVPGGHMYLWWQRQLPFGPNGGFIMQHNMVPRAYVRPAFFGPAPFAGGPPFPGPVHMHYRPMPPPGSIRGPFLPRFAQLVNPLASGVPPETLALRESIVRQIEFYFSDKNLLTDHYLISQMDDQGWVPISVIAEFKRVKRMCTDTQFILDALWCSPSVEVQGNKVRKRDITLKYVSCPAIDVKNNLPSEERMDSTTGGNTRSLSESDSKVNVSSNNDSFDASVDNAVVTSVAIDERVALQTSYKPSDIRSLPCTDSSNDTNLETEETEVLLCSAANVDKLSNDFSSTLMV